MNLSSDTVNVLKNFSDINQNILVKPGNKIQTISTMKNILAEAEVSEKFEDEFAIYDLPEFLRSVELFEKPELKFNGGTNVKMIPDGCGTFTRSMGMLVNKPAQGFGMRSWRYSAIINDGEVQEFFEEPGINNESADDDPYTVSSPEHMLSFLQVKDVEKSL